MHLTKAEDRILAGDEGVGRRKALELLVALGEIYGADRLIPIQSAHISGASFQTIGEAGLRYISDLAADAKVAVPSTLNPLGMDRERWREMGISEAFAARQEAIVRAYEQLGVDLACSCIPYHSGNRPQPGEHVAWAESSAVVYANSVLRARTNREGGPAALAAAIIGKTPEYGLHLDQERLPSVEVALPADLSPADLAPLGYWLGEVLRDRIPYLRNLRLSDDDHKTLGASLASTGALSLYYWDASPPPRTDLILERLSLDRADLEDATARLGLDKDPELVAFGCPQLSESEVVGLARALEHRRPRGDLPVWFFTTRVVAQRCPAAIEQLRRFGKVLCDTCLEVAPIHELFSSTATDSAKACVYLPTVGRQRVCYCPTRALLDLIG